MALLYDLAVMTVASAPGVGTIHLGGALPPYLTFAQAGVTDGQTVSYSISDGTLNSECGRGVYTAAGTTLSRSPLHSTNGNAAINASGNSIVRISLLAEDMLFTINAAGNTANGAASVNLINFNATVNIPSGAAYQYGGQNLITAVSTLANTFFGFNSGNFTATSGPNIGIGTGALLSVSSGFDNSAIGDGALQSLTVGVGNIAIGHSALTSNVSGSYNLAISGQALVNLSSGQLNTAIGWNALGSLTTGQNNVAIGYNALATLPGSPLYNTVVGTVSMDSVSLSSNAQYNTVIGAFSGKAITSGFINTLVGYGVANSLTTGQQNVCIGYGAGGVLAAGNYNICIGYNSTSNSNNAIVIGDGTGGNLAVDYNYTTPATWTFANTVRVNGDIYSNDPTYLIRASTTLTNGAGGSAGTLTNAPAIGNPTKWIAIDDNGTKRQIPAW